MAFLYMLKYIKEGVYMNNQGLIRQVELNDAKDILDIYAPYVKNTIISFELEVPSLEDFTSRIVSISSTYPYLVYVIDNKIVGYAYATKHQDRAAYQYNVEVSIYVDENYHGKGIAIDLYTKLFDLLKQLGYINVYARYTGSNIQSQKFHEKFGFSKVGTMHKSGFKFDQWHDVTWLEKSLSNHLDKPNLPKSIKSINHK